ncbi:hypothetical protein REPUB_Repub04eG0217600 [Reevesia pubescens]
MESRIPVQQHYNNSFITNSLHDLNTDDSRPSESTPLMLLIPWITIIMIITIPLLLSECMHESYRNSLPIHALERRKKIDLSARVRFWQIIVDYFINDHVIEVVDNESLADYNAQSGQDKLSKRKTGDVQYEGDPRFALPLMYVANLYETLVNEVNLRISSLNGIHGKTIGVALEAAGGLYRRLAKKFPKKVNGLDIVERPNNVPIEDAEWFKRLTGQNEVVISARDYKFYSPRHKYRHVPSNTVSNLPALPTHSGTDSSSPMSNAQGFSLSMK